MWLTYAQREDIQGQELILAAAAPELWHWLLKPPLLLINHMAKRLSHSKMKWWAIYTDLPANVTVRLTYPQIKDIQGQEMISAPFPDNQTQNYDTDCSNHRTWLSTLKPKGLSHSRAKYQEMFLASSADN